MVKNIQLLIIFFSVLLYAESQSLAISPMTVQNNERITKGCIETKLKGDIYKNCVAVTFNSHDLVLTVFDIDRDGIYTKMNQFLISSWYNEATVYYKDLIGKGTYFIIVEFEGNTGTGTFQKILGIIGWHNGRFVPVLIEPLSYYIERNGRLTELIVDYEFLHSGTSKLSLHLKYKYSQEFIDKIVRCNWNERLEWNERNFSFYGKNINKTQQIKDASTPVRKNITAVRNKVINSLSSIKNIDLIVLEQIEIMNILEENVVR